jgi:glycerophosphodiester phosphodiesterase
LDELDQSEVEDLLGTCIELREGIKKLMWYGNVNRDGFQKILQKLDKVQLCCGLDLKPLEEQLSKSQFASQIECRKDLEALNGRIADASNALLSNQSNKTHRLLALVNFCTRFYPTLSCSLAFYEAIAKDDAFELDHILQATEGQESGGDFQPLVLALLRCSVGCGSRLCIEKLLFRAESLKDDNFPNNFLHSLIIRTGRESAPNVQQGPQQHLRGSYIHNDEELLPLLGYILERLRPSQRDILLERDSFGRLPLHYAAEYGLVGACQAILKSMHDWGLSSASFPHNPTLLPDSENHTPLHLAVIGGHSAAAKTLFEFYNMSSENYRIANDSGDLGKIFGDLLAVALKSDFLEIVQVLVGSNMAINHRGKYGETALHIAVRSGREDYVRLLLNQSADVDALETVYGWSPLIISCVKGHMHIVDILLQAGANQAACDLSGWTAKDHASFRGYMKIAVRLFAPNANESASIDSNEPNLSGPDTQGLCTPCAVQNGEYITTSKSNMRSPIRESQVLVNLGSYASNKSVKAVDLSPYISLDSSTSHPETGYSITISAIGAMGPSHVVQLPILENMTNIPRLFSAPNLSEAKIVFHVFRATSETDKDVLVGSGIALLENLKQGLGSKRESLMRDYTIPILEKDTLKFMGTVTFNFVIITPLPQPDLPSIATEKLWNQEGPTKIVGHRGNLSCLRAKL